MANYEIKNLMNVADKIFKKCMQGQTDQVIKGRVVLQYTQSPFAFYCDCFVNDSKKDPYDENIIHLAQKGIYHEDQIIADKKESILNDLGIDNEDQTTKEQIELIPVNFKETKIPTMRENFSKCLDEMINKKTRVLHDAPLFYLPLEILGKPDTLERKRGKSSFGSYHYIVKEVKLARNIKYHHILQAAFYNLMIGKIQRYIPKEFYIINGDKKEQIYQFRDYKKKLEYTLGEIKKIQNGDFKPEPILGKVPYPWSKYGDEIAIKNRGITLINGIKEAREHKLKKAGLNTINKIASCNIQKLSKIPTIGNNRAKQIIAQAKALKQKKEIRKIYRTIPKRTTEIFLDFEGVMDGSWIYLIGILIRNNKKEEYVSFVIRNKRDEKIIWADFLKFMKKQKDYVIYHWHHYEKTHIQRMASKYKQDKKLADLVLSEDVLIDLHKVVTSSFAFPTFDNSLKTIANWMGFSWKDSEIEGNNVGVLFKNYCHNPRSNKYCLQLVLDYNCDDCKATKIIKDWMARQK